MAKKSKIQEVVDVTSLIKPEPEKKVAPPVAADYLMWVGAVHYPTYKDYIDEARRIGVSKRIGKLPHNLVPGKSRVFLAHDDGVNGDGFIFGYFVPERIEYLAPSEDEIPENIFDRVHWVSEWSDEEERECGFRHEGAYMVTFGEVEDEDEAGVTPDSFVDFKSPRSLQVFDPARTHFRGLLQIDYGEKLIKAKKSQCFTPPSKNAHKPIDPKTPWTEEEDETILEALGDDAGETMARAAQILAYKTGRARSAILYRFRRLTGSGEGSEEDGE